MIAVTEGELEAELDAVDRCLREHLGAAVPMDVAPADAVFRPIELWLELPGAPGWKGLAHVDGRASILAGEGAALVQHAR